MLNRQNNNKDDLLMKAQEMTKRKGFSFTNVRKISISPLKPLKPWNIENIALTFFYNEMRYNNFYTAMGIDRNSAFIFDYNFSTNDIKFKTLFKKINSDKLAFLRDFKINLSPTALKFKIDINRIYRENKFRDNSSNNTLPTYYNKNFNVNRIYGISWNLTPALQIDFNATNYAIIDEPNPRIDGAKVDTLWLNFWKLGRTIDYSHMLNINYKLTFNRIHFLNWIQFIARYGVNFNWQSQPINQLKNENISLGNSIQNNRIIQLNPTFNFKSLYNKFRFFRNHRNNNKLILPDVLIQLATAIRQLNIAHTKSQGIFLPGYLPKSTILGYDFKANAPGLPFLLGSQQNIVNKAIENDWLTTDSLQNTPITYTYVENTSAIINSEPIKNLRIDFTFNKVHNKNTVFNLQFDNTANRFQKNLTNEIGNYTISIITLRSVFRKNSSLMEEFNLRKQEASLILATSNINSVGQTQNLYADGYGKDQQDVIINAFLNTYTNHRKISINRKPSFPLPNWRLYYNGLATLLSLEDFIQTIAIKHTYQSFYSINGYNSNTKYLAQDGIVYSRDENANFIPQLQYNSVTITNRFLPLLAVDIHFKNALTISTEYRQSKDVNLSLQNNQFVLFEDKSLILGLGFRKNNIKVAFGSFADKGWKSDIHFKLDFAINNRKTTIIKSEKTIGEIVGGNKSITLNPTLDCTINRKYLIRLFYNTNSIQPYTSQNYTTAYTYFGVNFSILFQ